VTAIVLRGGGVLSVPIIARHDATALNPCAVAPAFCPLPRRASSRASCRARPVR
jgi:hypothetical protein